MRDPLAEDAIQKIQEFASSNTSANLLVLAVMCHGDECDYMKFPERELTAEELRLIFDQRREFPAEQVSNASLMPG